MNRFIISLILSVALHVTAIAAITTMQLLYKPEKKKTKIMFIKPVKMSELRTLKPEPAKPKPIDKKIDKPIKPKVEQIAKKPVPSPTPTPLPVGTPVPEQTKKPVKKTDPKAEKLEKEQKAKIAFLKKQPYFKNWPEERMRRLELPPGMKSWEEAKELTDYFDKQYNWTQAPPNLKGTDGTKSEHNPDVNPYVTPKPDETPAPEVSSIPIKTSVPTPTPTPVVSTAPNPEGTPIPWNIFTKDPQKPKIYDIRFYKDNIGFIGTIDEDKMKITVAYFTFDPVKAEKDPDGNVLVGIPVNLKPEAIKNFELPLTKEDLQDKNKPEQDIYNKEQIVVTIIRQYELLER